MKSLNRTLSLILVLTMVFGLFGVASAAFTDNSKVQYPEAVGVMTGIGAINGYTDGSFKPAGTITREEAAKMVTYAVLGTTVASKLGVTATGFKDVAADRWSAPYIAYCVSKGIINGLGDGTFAPTANVTGYQLAKMMLAAAGYGAKGEFTGSSWELNVAVTGNRYKVFNGSKATDFTKAATREEAALYVFNALSKVPEVTYSKLTEAYTNTAKGTNDINSDNYLQIAEEVYSTLTKEATVDNGRTGYSWKLGSTYLTDFIANDAVLATSTDGTSFANLTDATNSKYIKVLPDTTVTYLYQDGAASPTWPTAAAGADDAAKTAVNVGVIQGYAATAGAIVQFLDTDNNGKYNQVSIVVKAVQQLAAAPVTTTTGSVTKITIGSHANVDVKNIVYPAGLAKDDVILSYVSQNGTTYVEKATAVTGTISSFVTGQYVTINGVNYYDSGLAGAPGLYAAIGDLQGLIGKAGFTFYLDNGKNICYTVAPTGAATVSNSFFVAATDSTTSFGTTTYKASIVKMDGSQDVITVNKTASFGGTLATVAGTTAADPTSGNLGAGLFYTYAKNSDGSYNLTAAKNQTINATDLTVAATVGSNAIDVNDTSFVVTGNKAQFLGAVTATADDTWNGLTPNYASSKVATSNTIFMYYDATAKTYSVKTGIANAASYAAGGTVYVLADTATDTYAQVVIMKGASSTATTSAYDQVFVTSVATSSLDANNTTLYTYNAIVNGVIGKTISSYDALTAGTLYFVKDYASNGAVVSGTALTTLTGMVKHDTMVKVQYANGVMTVDGATDASYILNSNCKIFVYDATNTPGTVTQINADQAAALTYDTTHDAVFVMPTSSTDSSIAAVYIFID